jgi:hypothetical protein
MKMLYYASYVLSAPFYAVAWVFYWAAYCVSWIADAIFDATTCRAWTVLHRRACSKPNAHDDLSAASADKVRRDVGNGGAA